MSKLVTIRFYEELNDFLAPDLRKTDINYQLKQPRSAKDLIESFGVPHTEIDLIIVNGISVDFNYIVRCGDHLSIYPVFESLDISPLKHCQEKPLRNIRFVLDAHLGRLAAYLRMLGFDTLYRNDYSDPVLAAISIDKHRILLTCDRKLLMRKQITHGYYVRARHPQQQLIEVMSRFDLVNVQNPFTRCMHCNGKTNPVDKQSVKDQLPDKTIRYFNEFFQCEKCKKVYWKGSHYQKMKAMIDRINEC